MKKLKHNIKNLDIKTRIAIAAISGIGVAVLLIGTFVSVLDSFLPNYYNYSDVNTNTYSMLNTVQWNQTTESVANELLSQNNRENTIKNLDKIASDLAKVNASLYIEKIQKSTTFLTTTRILKIWRTALLNLMKARI